MSISPVLLLKKYTKPTIEQEKEAKSSLQQVFDDFDVELKATTPQSVRLEVKPLGNKSPDKFNISTLAEVFVYPNSVENSRNKDNQFIEIVYILARKEIDETTFTILPSVSTSSYNIKRHGSKAKMRTEALTAIANALFKVSKSNVCITTSDKALGTSPAIYDFLNTSKNFNVAKADLFNVLQDSKFTLVNKDFIPEIERILDKGDVNLAWLKDFGNAIGYAESDQPFSLSSSSSTDINNYHFKSMFEALRNLDKEK